MRKATLVLLALVATLLALPAQALGGEAVAAPTRADASVPGVQTVSDTSVNPAHADLPDAAREAARDGVATTEDGAELLGGPSFSSRAEAAAYLKERGLARDSLIEFTLYDDGVTSGTVVPIAHSLFATATAEDPSDPKAGDYLRFHYVEYHVDCTFNEFFGWCTFTYTFTWASSAAEERAVDQAVPGLLASLGVTGKSEYQKALLIHDWIVLNVDYDLVHLDDPVWVRDRSAYGALVTRSATCNGFSTLYYLLCREAGVSTRVITGMGNGGPHAWNITRIGGSWYNVDTTWDENNTHGSAPTRIYFLKSPADFPRHQRDAEFETASFHAAHPMSSVSYDPAWDVPSAPEPEPVPEPEPEPEPQSIAGFSLGGLPDNAVLWTGSAIEPRVTLTAPDGTVLGQGSDYTVSYANNVLPGTATVTLTGIGDYRDSVTGSFTIAWSPECGRFIDTPESAWYVQQGVIDYVSDNGIMGGYSGDQYGWFGPEDQITRGMVATLLYRLAGEPPAYGADPFSDVDYNMFYGDPITWCRYNGIISGYDERRFGPDDPVTREQLSKMLAEYARRIHRIDVFSDCAAASAYADWDGVSAFAIEYMGWAVDKGIMSGKVTSAGTLLAPTSTATRAEAAKMIMVLDRDVVDAFVKTEPWVAHQDGISYLVFAGTEGYIDDDWYTSEQFDANFRYVGRGAYALGVAGASGDLVLPASVDGLPVVYANLEFQGFTSIDASECPELVYLDAYGNELERVDLSGCAELRELVVSSNYLSELDVRDSPLLERLEARYNNIEAIDVTHCTELTYLDVDGNNLEELDVSRCSKLETLSAEQNRLREFDVSACTGLAYLGCGHNLLTRLDISGLNDLDYLYCEDNLIQDTSDLESWLAQGGHEGAVLPQAE